MDMINAQRAGIPIEWSWVKEWSSLLGQARGVEYLSAQNPHPWFRPSPGGGSETNMYPTCMWNQMILLKSHKVLVLRNTLALCD